jgi:hypothetical protein
MPAAWTQWGIAEWIAIITALGGLAKIIKGQSEAKVERTATAKKLNEVSEQTTAVQNTVDGNHSAVVKDLAVANEKIAGLTEAAKVALMVAATAPPASPPPAPPLP